MKFVSWNVNGLRACIGKGFLDQFNEMNADFFCLQETKLSEGQLQLDLPGYEQYWCYAEKKGYSGTAIFTKHTPQSVSYGIGVPELDNEGRVITLEYPEFYLVTCYTPNAQRGLARLDHRMTWDEAFRAYLKDLDSRKSVVICGDLNVAHQEIDLKNPKSNRGNAGFSDEERDSFQKTLDSGFVDSFRHLYPDVTGRYSWWSYMYHARENNAGWRIDYFLVSDRLKGSIDEADIHSDILGSDHCPVSLDLSITVNGGIWSPEPKGKASVIGSDEKSKKTPRASAVSAKALVAFGLVLLVLISSVTGYFYFFNHQFDAEYVTFPVNVYYQPFQNSYDEYYQSLLDSGDAANQMKYAVVSITEADDATRKICISDGFHLSLSESNIAVRIQLPEEARELDAQWNITLTSETKQIQDLHIEPYYSDPTLVEQSGWLIWGWLDSEGEFTLTVSSESVYQPYTQSISLVPYISFSEAEEMTTAELASYIVNHDYLYQKVVLEETGDTYFSYFSAICPAFQYFCNLQDAVSALLELECSREAAVLTEALLATGWFRSLMTPEDEAAYLTHQYPASSVSISFSDMAHDYSDVSTEDLLKDVLSETSLVGNTFAECSSRESAALVYEFYRPNLQILSELESREDTVEILRQHVSDSSNLIAIYLLTLDIYADQLTQQELTGLYDTVLGSSVDQFVCMLGENPPKKVVEKLTTEQLVTYLMNHETLSLDIHNLLAMSYGTPAVIYSILNEAYPLFSELESRDDIISVLMNSPCASDHTIVSNLLSLTAYNHKMTPQEKADYLTMQYPNSNGSFTYPASDWEDLDTLPTDQLVRLIFNVDIDLLLQCRTTETAELVYGFLLNYSPILNELQTRDDAVHALMNESPRENTFICHYLLSLEVYQQKMTEEEMTAYQNKDYPTYPDFIYG